MAAPQQTSSDWFDVEPAIPSILIRELQRLKRRMKAHPFPVLLLAALLAGAAVFSYARKPRLNTGRVVLRISEGALTQYSGNVLPRGAVKDYVYGYLLTKEVILREIVEKEGLFREELELFGKDGAVEAVREWLNISVYHNYFYFNRRHEATPRSLRLIIAYTDPDPDFAFKMARLLADIVIDEERARRLQEMRYATQNARQNLADAEVARARQLETRSQIITDLRQAEADEDQSKIAVLRTESQAMTDSLRQGRVGINALRRAVDSIEQAQLLEERHMGLIFETAEQIPPLDRPPPGPVILSVIGLICFCIFVPVCAIGIGTLDSRIHEVEDIRRLGMPIVGHVPSFQGDNVGSLEQRGAIIPLGFFGRLRARFGLGPRRRIRRRGVDRVA